MKSAKTRKNTENHAKNIKQAGRGVKRTQKTLILGGKNIKIVPKPRYSMIFNESESAKNMKKQQKS